jgi:hypothetical protein
VSAAGLLVLALAGGGFGARKEAPYWTKIRGVVARRRAGGVVELYSLYRYRSGRRAACSSGCVPWTAD